MTSQTSGRAAIMLQPSLPTIKETTLSWLGSELDSSLFASNGENRGYAAPNPMLTENVQRYIDFDDQCLSLKSGEGSTSEFSGIQPFPVGSDDTPPMAVNEFKSIVHMGFKHSIPKSENLPKPFIQSDNDDSEAEDNEVVEDFPDEGDNNEAQFQPVKNDEQSNFEPLLEMLDSKMMEGEIGELLGQGNAMEKLQLIRLWQLMQQQELRKRQEAEIAMLNAQREKMKIDRQESQIVALEKVENEDDLHLNEEYLESGDLEEEHNSHDESLTAGESNNHDNKSHNYSHHDDVPVEGEKKSFEQLLEEELKKEGEKQKKNDKSKGPIKRPFLRKGQGIARFNGPPKRKPVRKNSPDLASNQNNAPKFSNKNQENKREKTVITKKPPVGAALPKSQTRGGKGAQMQQPPKQKFSSGISKSELKPEMENKKNFTEDVDLEEFEMLERYAEDDASFFNEPSLVVSVLQQDTNNDMVKLDNQLSLRERVRERRRLREKTRAKIQDDPKLSELHVGNMNISQPVITSKSDVSLEDNSVDEILSPLPPKPYFKSPEKQKVKTVQRKTASLVKREKLIHPIAKPAVACASNQPSSIYVNGFNQLCSSPNTAFSPHQQQTTLPRLDTSNTNSAFVENLNQKDNYEQGNEFQDEQTWGDINDSVLNTSLPPSAPIEDFEKRNINDAADSPKAYKVTDYMEPENEDIENPVRDTETKVSNKLISLSPPPPPTSLMQKLFPGLEVPKPSSAPSVSYTQQDSRSVQSEPSEVINDAESVTSQDPLQASVLKQKLLELETEIAKFKKENETLENLRKRQEEDLKTLEKEMTEFRNQKETELARLEEFKKAETKKLKKEKKLFEEHVLATRMMPRKEEREEIQKLQEELETLRSDNKAKEQKWISSNNRMRNQVERLETENKQLQERINEIEAQRVIKEWNSAKSNQPKQSSVWKTLNKIVESSDLVAEIDNFDHLSVSNNKASKRTNSNNSSTSDLFKKPTNGEKSKPSKAGKSAKGLSPEVAYSNLKDTIEQTKSPTVSAAETMHKDGKVEKTQKDGSKVVIFPNGTQKEVSADGQTVKVRFANGDIKQMYGDGSIVYYYEENGTTHTTHRDGLQVFEFPNKQVEHHFPDGTKQITFPDQTIKYLHTDGTEQTVFPDGTEMHIATNKDKTIVFANGQREIHTSDFKKREYPDGTSKTVFSDGRQETRYASGRLRVKDAHGNVIIDRMNT